LDTHETLIREDDVQNSSDRSFGIVFAVVFLVLALRPLLRGHSVRIWMIAVSAAFLAVALIRPGLLAPANALWLRLGALLHRIVGPLVTGLLFYGVFTPTGYLLRLSGKDLLRLRSDPDAGTYWISRTPAGPEPGSMTRQF